MQQALCRLPLLLCVRTYRCVARTSVEIVFLEQLTDETVANWSVPIRTILSWSQLFLDLWIGLDHCVHYVPSS